VPERPGSPQHVTIAEEANIIGLRTNVGRGSHRIAAVRQVQSTGLLDTTTTWCSPTANPRSSRQPAAGGCR